MKLMRQRISFTVLLFTAWTMKTLTAATLHVGPGEIYPHPAAAAADAEPGDTILIHPGTYNTTYFIEELHGQPNAWITIRGTGLWETVLGGGTESLHFTNCRYIVLENLVFERNTGNGVNIDDGGDYNSPAMHFEIRRCWFRNMGAQGNNDFLKLSGLDSFAVTNCLFEDGAEGGSGIDMVGCHWGIISGNRFFRMGSNSIQAKGGTRHLEISRNYFEDGGLRAMNLGGSTGAAYFRPPGANYEARDLEVFANITRGSDAPIAYVSSQQVQVYHNSFYLPERWVFRILQESGDTSFYRPVANGSFINNLVIVDSRLRSTGNIGPLTRPESFQFAHNLWWQLDDPNFEPVLPTQETGGITGLDPLLVDSMGLPVFLMRGSPAIAAGSTSVAAGQDFSGKTYANPPTIGAIEVDLGTGSGTQATGSKDIVYPIPATNYLRWESPDSGAEQALQVYDLNGKLCLQQNGHVSTVDISTFAPGLYLLRITRHSLTFALPLLVQ